MTCFILCICGSCNTRKHRDDLRWPPPCVGRCVFSFKVSRCRKNELLGWSDGQIEQVLGCCKDNNCGACEYFRDGAIDPDYKVWGEGCRSSHSIQNVYRLWPFTEISFEILVGFSGQAFRQGEQHKITRRLNDVTRVLARWYMANRSHMEPQLLEDGVVAKYLYFHRSATEWRKRVPS